MTLTKFISPKDSCFVDDLEDKKLSWWQKRKLRKWYKRQNFVIGYTTGHRCGNIIYRGIDYAKS